MSEKIKSRTFYVPKDLLGDFFIQVEESELDFELIDVIQDDEELEIRLSYTEDQKGDVMDLIELIDDYLSENEEEETEEEDEN